MSTKIKKEYIDYSFGFPIKLRNVPMIKVRQVWTPDIHYPLLTQVVLRALAYKPSRLTGHELRFIRHHFEMTLEAFSKRFCVTHVAVMKWEKTKDQMTCMHWTTEKDIRLFVLSKLMKNKNEISELYFILENLPEQKPSYVDLDLKKAA